MLSVRLVSYNKEYSIVTDVGSMGTEYCCCKCVSQSCCEEQAMRINPTCVTNQINRCNFSLSFCAMQGSSSVCRNTSFFNINNSTTFGGMVGDLTNPIHLIMPGSLGSEVSNHTFNNMLMFPFRILSLLYLSFIMMMGPM